MRRWIRFVVALIFLALSLALAAPSPAPIGFVDVAREAGVTFRFDSGSRGRHDLPEIMGGGVALIDIDGDGRLDVYLCNGGPIVADAGKADPPCRLFRNLGGWRFEDVTDRAHAPGPSYAMGTAVGDYDGDGLDDLLVTGWRDQRLYRNIGGGRFEDTTVRAGVVSNLWSTSAAFADLDGDGDLDLYVAAYLDFDPNTAPFCAAPDGKRDFCGPEEFADQADRLYRNDGDGTFVDISKQAGVGGRDGRGLGVIVADLVGDSRPDIFVANDGTACRLYENRGGLKFVEAGLAAGVAFDGRGEALAGMGVALGDIDGDGKPDLVVSNFLGRSTVGFRGLGSNSYLDASAAFGLSAATRSVLGFGVALADFDLDGRLDLLQANGHVLDRSRLGDPFAMRPTLLRNASERLVDASRDAGPWFNHAYLARGLAVGDLDGDGAVDAVVNILDGPAALLKNVGGRGQSLAIDIPLGARVRATVGGRVLVREVVAGGSYLSTSDHRLVLGLGDSKQVDRLEVTWPSSRVEVWNNLPAGRPTWIREGSTPRTLPPSR